MSATQPERTPPPGTPAEDLKLVLPGRIEPAGAGWTWIVEGWKLFAKSPVMWLASIILLLIFLVVLRRIPHIGPVAIVLLNPVFAAGFMVACRSLERGGEFELEHLFAGFRTRFGSLVLVGLLTLLGCVAIILVFLAFAGFSLIGALLTGDADTVLAAGAASAVAIMLGSLVALALAVPIAAACWFAPALVVMHGMSPLSALKMSLYGSFRNFIPFLVYGIIMTLFLIIAVIPVGLGLLVWLPLTIASTYVAYRRIFTEGGSETLA
jgi:uncharacterized membrane protein